MKGKSKKPERLTKEDLENILDWAERDQNECLELGDEDSERETRANLRTIKRARARRCWAHSWPLS